MNEVQYPWKQRGGTRRPVDFASNGSQAVVTRKRTLASQVHRGLPQRRVHQ
jgi:hypothetical protein